MSSVADLYPTSQLKKIRDNFFEELKKASDGEKTSIAFIKNPFPQSTIIKKGEIFQVMVTGGAVFEKALLKKSRNKLMIIEKEKIDIPIFGQCERFFSFIIKYLDPNIRLLVINFAYHLKPLTRNGLIDGRLINPTKEHRFAGLVGKIVGQELENFISKRLRKRVRVTVVNDTICLLLSALPFESRSSQGFSTIAGIVGAGTNFAFFLNHNTAVNLESGNFDKFPQTETGKIIDRNSSNPGKQLFEKEVSGTYLYQHYNLLINGNKNNRQIESTFELSQQAAIHRGGVSRGTKLAQMLIERSASLIACQIAGIYRYKKQTVDNKRWKVDVEDRKLRLENPSSTFHHQNLPSTFYSPPSKLTFIMEGSLFWRGWHYKQLVEKYLEKLGVPQDAIKFIKIKNSGLIGASRLVTG